MIIFYKKGISGCSVVVASQVNKSSIRQRRTSNKPKTVKEIDLSSLLYSTLFDAPFLRKKKK